MPVKLREVRKIFSTVTTEITGHGCLEIVSVTGMESSLDTRQGLARA